MKLSPALLLLVGAACASSPPPAPAEGPAPAPAAAASGTAERAAMLAGCAQAIREPNEARYAQRSVEEKGAAPEAAAAEAKFMFSKAGPAFTNVCACFFTEVGEERIQKEGAAAMQAMSKESAEKCMKAMVEELPKYLPSADEQAEFAKQSQAKKPQ
ncbi:MAG: hypothetical protein U1E65_11170 [Myxococcota bacterium]